MAVLEEQAASVQDADMAVEGIHVVGMLHEDKEAGSQQP